MRQIIVLLFMPPSRPNSAGTERLLTLDAFRGFSALALVLGGLIAVHFQGRPTWQWLTASLRTSEHGFCFWFLLQPAFLFVCGAAIPYSLANRQGKSLPRNLLHVLVRAGALLALGLYLDAYAAGRFDAHSLRLTGPLQQIALSWFLAILVVPLGSKVQLAAVVFLLSTHTAAFYLHGKSIGVDPWTTTQNVGSLLDRLLGLATSPERHSTLDLLPATALVLLGAICGDMMRGALPPGRKVAVMAAAGLALLTLGWALSGGGGWMPVSFPAITPMSQRLQTASFTAWSAGWIYLGMGLFYLVVEVMLIRFWTLPFVVVGMNSLFLCLSVHLLQPVVRRSIALFVPPSPAEPGGSPLLSVGLEILVFWGICFWLHRKKAYFKV